MTPANPEALARQDIDRRLSLVRETEAQVDVNIQRAERLRQAILTKAFSGLLVQPVTGREMSVAG